MELEIKHTLLGMMIYAGMAFYYSALGAYVFRVKRWGFRFFAGGFVVLASAFVVRWIQVEHPPLQSLFEVFLCLGALTGPLWLFCRKLLGASGDAAAVIVGIVVMFPVGFVFKAEPQHLPPALQSWLFVPHVAAYMLAYMILVLASVQAVMQLLSNGPDRADAAAQREQATYNMVRLGFPLLTLGLALGAVWGQIAWGGYWNWDPKELWSLATFLTYIGYLHFRSVCGVRHRRACALLAILGGVLVIITLLWVNLASRFAGMHGYAT